MPGWYIHLHAAKRVAELLRCSKQSDGRGLGPNGEDISSFQAAGLTTQQAAELISTYPNYYALGAIGPDIFFLLPDFRGDSGNFIARLAEWVIDLYDSLDTNVFGPWEKAMGPIEEDQTEELSRLTGALSDQITQISNTASGIVTNAVLGFVSRLYDWFGLFSSGVEPGYDDRLFYWSDMFHYRRTNEFARVLFDVADKNAYTADGKAPGRYDQGLAFALGWMTHIGTDVTGHAFVNEKSGGPYRLHWQRHHLVENHMDAFVYNHFHGTDERYNLLTNGALHFWLQFNKDKKDKNGDNYAPDYSYFDGLPDYPTGLRARDYFERKAVFDVDSEIPPALARFLLDAMKQTFYADHTEADNGGMPTHPMVLAAIKPDEEGRPDLALMQKTYWLFYHFVKYTTTDYYKMPKPQPPSVFPNLDPPLPPGSNDAAPGPADSDWNIWDLLLAVLAWILYLVEWVEYLVTVLAAIIADLATYPARNVLYLFEEAFYEIWKAFRFLLVMEGFIMPEPDEVDLGLIQIGLPSNGPYHGLLALMDDVFGGLLSDNPNPVPDSEPVNDPLYPRRIVTDEPSVLEEIIGKIEEIQQPDCGLPKKCEVRKPSEFLRPWEYPLRNNEHSAVGIELAHTRAGPHVAGALPTDLLGTLPGADEARAQYEQASTPADTDRLNAERLNEQWNLGDSLFYSLHVMGQLTRENLEGEVACFNLDADRGYGYKCWDWNRHQPVAPPEGATRNPWKPPHWYVSEPCPPGAKFAFATTNKQTDEWLSQNAPGPSLAKMQACLMSPLTIAKALAAYRDETKLWKAVLSRQINHDFPNLGVPDLVPEWIRPAQSIQTSDPGMRDGYVEATGLVIRLTHPSAFPWTLSNEDLALDHSVIPYTPGHDDEGDQGWRSYQHYDYLTEANDEWKAERLASRTHVLDTRCTESAIGKGDWYYRDREFSLLLDPPYRHLLSAGNCDADDLHGCLGIEAESWQLDRQVMPEVGDRIYIAGRWVVDNGHSSDSERKHMEIHSPYVVVRQFQVPADAPFKTRRSGPAATPEAGAAVDIIVFVTGAWPGGRIEWDVFPPVRTHAGAVAQVQQQPIAPLPFDGEEPAHYDNAPDVTIDAAARGNHIHFAVNAPVRALQPAELRLGQEALRERRHISAYRISWKVQDASPVEPAPQPGKELPSTLKEAEEQIRKKFQELRDERLGDALGSIEELRERTEAEALADLYEIPKPKDGKVPEEYVYRETVTEHGWRQAYSNGSAIVWSSQFGAHLFSPPLASLAKAFTDTTGRVFLPVSDSLPNVSFGVDSFGNPASMEIVREENGSSRGFVAIYDPLADVLTGRQNAKARFGGRSEFEYWVPCTPTEQFNPSEICFDRSPTPHDIALDYDETRPLLLHYLRTLKTGESYPGCDEDSGGEPPPLPTIG